MSSSERAPRLQAVVTPEFAKSISDAACRCGMTISSFIGRCLREADVGAIESCVQPQRLIGGRSDYFKRCYKNQRSQQLLLRPPVGETGS